MTHTEAFNKASCERSETPAFEASNVAKRVSVNFGKLNTLGEAVSERTALQLRARNFRCFGKH